MARRTYSDDDRAAVFVALTVHDGNVARTSRDSGVPEQTVRDWKAQWAREGLPDELIHLAQQSATSFADNVERIRDKALVALETKLPDMSGRDLATTVGILTDKALRARGLDVKTVKHEHKLPSPDEVRQLMAGFAAGISEAAAARDQIIEAEVIEHPARKALPPGRAS